LPGKNLYGGGKDSSTRKAKVCYQFKKTGVCSRDKCVFAHGQKKSTVSVDQKTNTTYSSVVQQTIPNKKPGREEKRLVRDLTGTSSQSSKLVGKFYQFETTEGDVDGVDSRWNNFLVSDRDAKHPSLVINRRNLIQYFGKWGDDIIDRCVLEANDIISSNGGIDSYAYDWTNVKAFAYSLKKISIGIQLNTLDVASWFDGRSNIIETGPVNIKCECDRYLVAEPLTSDGVLFHSETEIRRGVRTILSVFPKQDTLIDSKGDGIKSLPICDKLCACCELVKKGVSNGAWYHTPQRWDPWHFFISLDDRELTYLVFDKEGKNSVTVSLNGCDEERVFQMMIILRRLSTVISKPNYLLSKSAINRWSNPLIFGGKSETNCAFTATVNTAREILISKLRLNSRVYLELLKKDVVTRDSHMSLTLFQICNAILKSEEVCIETIVMVDRPKEAEVTSPVDESERMRKELVTRLSDEGGLNSCSTKVFWKIVNDYVQQNHN
jgi:hypothetical protein